MNERVFRGAAEIDLRLTLAPLRHGPQDPTMRLPYRAREAWRALRTPDGAAMVGYFYDGDDIRVEAWGPGTDWALEKAGDALGVTDGHASFAPADDLMRRLHAWRKGLRMARSNTIVQTLVPTIIEQKVTTVEAHSAYRRLVYKFGEPAPGPGKLRVPPEPKLLASLPYEAYHPFGIEARRADFIRTACSYATRLEEIIDMPRDEGRARLRALPGIGPWTVAEVERLALGDADAVRPNDFHLPHTVAWVLAGERRATDERMMELLEPYRGHRARAALLIELSGNTPPRRAPRRRVRAIQHF